MKITLKDGNSLQFPEGVTVLEVATSLSEGLGRMAVAGKVNGELCDLFHKINEDASLEIITTKDPIAFEIFKHTASHILANAVKNLFPGTVLGIGPAIDSGFYYDFKFEKPLTTEDLDKIEGEMQKIIKADLPLERFELPRDEAIAFLKEKGEHLKVELATELPEGEIISFYKQGDFVDLCKGPHLRSTGKIKAFKLLQITGAYWKGSEKNAMLTRIYGCAFEKKSQLDEHLARLEEAKQRDHNKLGRELKIFMTDENVGQGLPLLMPKGAKLFQILQRFVEDEEEKRGFVLTKTPYMAKNNLFKISGHWDHYKDGMFYFGDEEKGEEVIALRPMTCPFQYTVYNNGLKSYRDLPIRYGETSTLFRNESSGEMHGLIRVRQFTISEGHIVCAPNQLEQEFNGCLDFALHILEALGLKEDVSFRFSKWDPNDKDKYIGDPKEWAYAEGEMKRILDNIGLDYKEAVGEAAFYGPKLDIQIKNVYGKEDTMITIQIDMFLSERFDMNYIDEKGEKKRPYIIHRTSIGCYERTMALLIEKYAGAFPTWLAPTQVKVLSLTDRTIEQAKALTLFLKAGGLRVEEDFRAEKIGYKIREAQLEKIPYMVILGDRDVEKGTISVRSRSEGELGSMTKEEFLEKISKEIKNKVNFV